MAPYSWPHGPISKGNVGTGTRSNRPTSVFVKLVTTASSQKTNVVKDPTAGDQARQQRPHRPAQTAQHPPRRSTRPAHTAQHQPRHSTAQHEENKATARHLRQERGGAPWLGRLRGLRGNAREEGLCFERNRGIQISLNGFPRCKYDNKTYAIKETP